MVIKLFLNICLLRGCFKASFSVGWKETDFKCNCFPAFIYYIRIPLLQENLTEYHLAGRF